MRSIAILITCHNRKLKTLECLSNLYKQDGIFVDFVLDVFLVDDASIDGTSDEIRKHFPEVNIIYGDGNLYWNRGMHLAWKTAYTFKDFDYYLWLNDDTFLNYDSISILINSSILLDNKSVVIGSTFSHDLNRTSYGGYSKRGKLLVPNGKMQESSTFNGNIVLIPQYVFNRVGILDPRFIHAIGDFEYALRIRKYSLKSFIAPSYLGICEGATKLPKWCQAEYSLLERIRNLYSPLGNSHPYYFFLYNKMHNGYLIAIKQLLSTHIRLLLPSLWLKKNLFFK